MPAKHSQRQFVITMKACPTPAKPAYKFCPGYVTGPRPHKLALHGRQMPEQIKQSVQIINRCGAWSELMSSFFIII